MTPFDCDVCDDAQPHVHDMEGNSWPDYPLDVEGVDPVAVLLANLDRDLRMAGGRSCYFEFGDGAATAIVQALAAFAGFACVHRVNPRAHHVHDTEVLFGLTCSCGDPLEDRFIAYVEGLGGRYTGS